MGLAALFAMAISAGAAASRVTRGDVMARLRTNGTLRLDAELVGVRFSRTHLVRLRYRVRGCYGVRSAEWRLRPMREVVVNEPSPEGRVHAAIAQ